MDTSDDDMRILSRASRPAAPAAEENGAASNLAPTQSDEVIRREAEPAVVRESISPARRRPEEPILFQAEARTDGTYSVALTGEGLQSLETALGIARDLGGGRKISTDSSLADLMDRTAVREELSSVLREPGTGGIHRLRVAVLRRRLWGSEEPSSRAKSLAHAGKVALVWLVLLWSIVQFGVAMGDIGAIPGILANIPGDIVSLQPTASIDRVGERISDAERRFLFAAFGLCLTYLVAKMVRPTQRIYRNDQVIPGEGATTRAAADLLRRWETRR